MPGRSREDAVLNPDFSDMLSALSDEGAEYLLVGAYAVAVHGIPRATGDLDLWVRISAENAARVRRALARFGAPLSDRSEADLRTAGTVVQIGIPPRRIDLLTSLDGISSRRRRTPEAAAAHAGLRDDVDSFLPPAQMTVIRFASGLFARPGALMIRSVGGKLDFGSDVTRTQSQFTQRSDSGEADTRIRVIQEFREDIDRTVVLHVAQTLDDALTRASIARVARQANHLVKDSIICQNGKRVSDRPSP